ncbi:MAG: ATP-binding protein [Bacteroidales bacterium]
MDSFIRTHRYLVEHISSPVKRELMNEINWSNRLIGIKGTRGVGKTTFLLQYAKDYFGANDKSCLYINMNNLYFTNRTLEDFAEEFYKRGGKTLLIDQIFKYPDWSNALRHCYDNIPELKIVFAGSSAMRLKEENPILSGIVDSYYLRGFSFREFLNLMSGENFPHYTLEQTLSNHVEIATEICSRVKPLAYLPDYIHHGFYPFFLEQRNFSENLLKTINMMIEGDIFFLKEIEVSYYHKIRKLLYLLSNSTSTAVNVSQLSNEIKTSRATVMNYIKYLQDARLINLLYTKGDSYPKKPSQIYLHNTNIMYPLQMNQVDDQTIRETFFYNALYKEHEIHVGEKSAQFLVNEKYNFRIEGENIRGRINSDFYYARDLIEVGEDNIIPLWLFGFLY